MSKQVQKVILFLKNLTSVRLFSHTDDWKVSKKMTLDSSLNFPPKIDGLDQLAAAKLNKHNQTSVIGSFPKHEEHS